MEIKKKELKSTVVDVICDCCGKSCKTQEGVVDNDIRDDHGETWREFDRIEIDVAWGYGSKSKDTERWQADICEECVDKHMGFVNFRKSNYL